MEAGAQEFMTLWNANIEAGPYLPDNGEVPNGINLSLRRQNRYEDESDEQSPQPDCRSPDSKGYESNAVEDETDENGTYLGLWKKQMGSHDGCPASDDSTKPESVALDHENMPIRPGIGPGSYARTFEELLENTLKSQEIGIHAGGAQPSLKKLDKDGSTLLEVCSADDMPGQTQGLLAAADAESCSLTRLQQATQSVLPFLSPHQDRNFCRIEDYEPEEFAQGKEDKAAVFDSRSFARFEPFRKGHSLPVADLTEVEGGLNSSMDVAASYPISSCEDSISLDEKASYLVSSCEDTVSLEEEKESVDNETNSFCSLNQLENCLLEERLEVPEDKMQHHSSIKEPQLCQLDEKNVRNAEVQTEDSNERTVTFEDILALLKVQSRKGAQPAATILNDMVCEPDAMDNFSTTHQVPLDDESNSCLSLQVTKPARDHDSEAGNGIREVQVPCVHLGSSIEVHDVYALDDLEHMHLSGDAVVGSTEFLCLSENDVNGFCFEIDSYPRYSMEVVQSDESVHSAALVKSVKQNYHQIALYGAPSTQLDLVNGSNREADQDCSLRSGTSKEAVDQDSFGPHTDRGGQVNVPENGQAEALGMEAELPIRACLVPIQDLVNRPRERGGRHVGPNKHKAVLLYKNPLWTDDSSQDLPLLMSHCQLQDESKPGSTEFGDHAVQSQSSTRKVDRRRGWNIDESVSVNALRMASLLVPEEETQDNEEHDCRPCRKRCKGLFCDETSEDDCENGDGSWLSRNSLSDGYVGDIIVESEWEGTVERSTNFLTHETNRFESHRGSNVQCDRSWVFAAHAVPEEDFGAQQLSNTYSATNSVGELMSVVEQDYQVETSGSERERSSGSGWLFPFNDCVVQTSAATAGCAKSAHATWRESVEKSENLLQFSYAHSGKALEQAIFLDSGERLSCVYQQQTPRRRLEEAGRKSRTSSLATMSGYLAAPKAYGRSYVNTTAGRQLGRAATSSIRDIHSCHSSSTASPKSVMQADHVLEVDNDFGDCVIKENQFAQKSDVVIPRKANGLSSGQGLAKVCTEDSCIQCETCRPSSEAKSTPGLQEKPGFEEVEVECTWMDDGSMANEGDTGARPPISNIEREQCSVLEVPLRQKGNEPVGGTQELLAALELEEFRFLERRVRKEVEGTQIKVVSSLPSGESRAPTTIGGRDSHFHAVSSSPNVGSFTSSVEERGCPKQSQHPVYAEPKYKFDDKGSWSEDHRQAKDSSRQERIAPPGSADINGSKISQKQETADPRPGDTMSKLVRSYFLPGKTPKVTVPRAGTPPVENKSRDTADGEMVLQKKVEALEAEIMKFQTETRKVQRLVKEHEEKASQLCSERAAWEQKKCADLQKFQEFKNDEMRKVKKNHQMLEKLSQEMLQLPTKKERNQIEDLKAVLSATKEEHAKKETRWRLTEKRLRGIIDELTGQSRELQEEIKRYEARLHQKWQAKDSVSVPKCERGTSMDYNVLSISTREVSHHISMEECTSYQQTTGVKMTSEVFAARHEGHGSSDSRLGPLADLSVKEMVAAHETTQSKGGRRMDMAAFTELSEPGCAVHATGTTYSKSTNYNCFVRDYDEPLSSKRMGNDKIVQNNEPREYVDMHVVQPATAPKTMLLKASEMGQPTSGIQCPGSAKTQEYARNSETSEGRTLGIMEPFHQQNVSNENFKGSANASCRGHVEDRQHAHSNADEISSIARNSKHDEEQVSVDDCVYFANGDIKNTLPDGSIEYYYSEVDTWHTTKPSGVEIFYFPDYQVEEHWPNGQKKIISPDGSFYVVGGE